MEPAKGRSRVTRSAARGRSGGPLAQTKLSRCGADLQVPRRVRQRPEAEKRALEHVESRQEVTRDRSRLLRIPVGEQAQLGAQCRRLAQGLDHLAALESEVLAQHLLELLMNEGLLER